MQPSSDHWFRNTALYQIYPRSFFDSDGDGIGDLRGITQRLRYLNGDDDSLGIGAIWLSPFYPSPMADFGYDVTDHCNVDPLFGNLDDFNQLIAESHKRSIKVLIDLIPNHTSDEHAWFKESKRSKDDPRRGWYTWRDSAPDGGPPNNWVSVFGGPAWEFDKATGQYYLHSYLKKQPDLNWENAGVREAIRQVMRFWLDLGVDGFRVDAVSSVSKDPHLRDDPINKDFQPGDNPYHQLLHINSKEGPKLFEYMDEKARVLHEYKDRFMIFEASPASKNRRSSYLKLYEHVDASVAAPFNFEGIHSPWDAQIFKTFIDDFQSGMHPSYIPVYAMGNHDQPRLASRIGERQARASAVMQFCLPGMPVVYYGDEIGMENTVITSDEVKDPFELQVPGKGLGRDPERTPMQWSASENAGFSKGTPWLPINIDFIRKNVESERLDPHSFFNLYQQIIQMRKSSESLRHGAYESIQVSDDIFCFKRSLLHEKMVSVINYSDKSIELTHEELRGTLLVSSYLDSDGRAVKGSLTLRPYEAVVLKS